MVCRRMLLIGGPFWLWFVFNCIVVICSLVPIQSRRWTAPLVCYLSWQLIRSIHQTSRSLSEIYALHIYYSILYAVQVLYFSAREPATHECGLLRRLRTAFKTANDPRMLQLNIRYTGSPTVALTARLRLLLYSWSMCLGLIILNPHVGFGLAVPEGFKERCLISLISRILRHFFARVCMTVLAIYLPQTLLNTAHTLLAALFVCVLRVDEIREWPPLFDDIADIQSVGTFWSR